MSPPRRTLLTLASISALAFGGATGVAQARHGADDGPGHHRTDDRAHHARHGADDGPNHDAGDDGGGRRRGR